MSSEGSNRETGQNFRTRYARGVLEVFTFAGGAIATAFVTALLVGPDVAWPLGSVLSTLVYLVLVGLEIALAEKMRLDNGGDEAS